MLYNKKPLIYIPKKKKITQAAPAPEPVDPTVYKNMIFARIPTLKVENGRGVKTRKQAVLTVCFSPSAHADYPAGAKILNQLSYDYYAGNSYAFTMVLLDRQEVSSGSGNFSDVASGLRWVTNALTPSLNVHAYFVKSGTTDLYHIKNLLSASLDPTHYALGLAVDASLISYRSSINNVQYSSGDLNEWYIDYLSYAWSSVAQPLNQIQNKLSAKGILPTTGGALMLIFGGTLSSGHAVIPGWDDNSALSLINTNPLTGRGYWGYKTQVVDFDMNA